MRWFVVSIMAFLATSLAAEPLSERSAKRDLFGTRGYDVQLRSDSGLGQSELAIVRAFVTNDQIKVGQRYYGSVAVAPDFFARLQSDPNAAAMSGLMQVTENFHSPQAAANAALSACETARSGRGEACTIAAFVLPRRYQSRPLQLSVTATEAFRAYERSAAPKAFAISSSTGQYAIGTGATAHEAAVARCNSTTGGANDCQIVVAD